MKYFANLPRLVDDGYPDGYLKFIQDNKDKIPPMTKNESELMQMLYKQKLGGFEKVVKIYRDCTK